MERQAVWLRRARKTGIAAAISIASFAMLGFVVAPPIARHVAQTQLGELLGRDVRIAKLRLNPFALSVTVEAFEILEPDHVTSFAGFSRLYVNAQLSSVFRRAPVIKEIRLESPHVRVVRMKATADAWSDIAGAYNFSDIVTRLAARPKAPEPATEGGDALPRFSLNNIQITGGAVSFEDRALGQRHEVTDFSLGVPFVSTMPVYLDSFVEPGLSVRVDGTRFSVAGRTKPFKDSLETVLELRLQSLDLTRYVPYVPLRLGFSVASAQLTLALDVSFVRPQADAPRLTIKGGATLAKVDLREKRKSGTTPLLALDELAVAIGAADITAQRFEVERIAISGLNVHARRLRDGTLNFEHLVPPPDPDRAGGQRAEPRKPDTDTRRAPRAAGPRYALGELTLRKAAVHFRDEAVSPAFESEVEDVALTVRGLSNAPGATATVSTALRAVPGGTLRQQGTLRLDPLAASGSITVEGIEPARLDPYYRDQIAFDVIGGRVRVGTGYVFERRRPAPLLRASDAFVDITDLALRRRGAREDFFRLPALSIKGGRLDLSARTLTVSEISSRGGRVRAARNAEGVVDLTTLLAPAAAPAAPPAPTAAATPPPPDANPQANTAPAWTIAVARLDVDKWGARFDDRALRTRALVTLDPITVRVTDFSTAPGAKMGVDVRLGINKTGRLQVTGAGTIDPLAANLRFDLRDIELVPLQAYVQEQLDLTFTAGKVTLRGKASVQPARPRAVDQTPQVKAAADLEVAELATVDRAGKDPLIGWKSLRVTGVNLATSPLALSVGEVSLTDLGAHVIVYPDGTLNLERAFSPAPAPEKATAGVTPAASTKVAATRTPPARGKATATPAAQPPQVSVGKVTLQGARVTFNDRTVTPAFTTDLTDFGGEVSGLSSNPGTTATVDLKALVNRTGALAIAGKLNPLAKDLTLDLQFNVSDVELPPASPYSGKYVGLTIRKGKLGLALDYKIANRKLAANNKVLIDQLSFGDKVDSPDATKLPVRLAVVLLRDRKGLIDVTLPIEGSLDDPDFKIWRAVLKVITNLLAKAATAPFSLIASAFGGGDELSRIDFPSGTADPDATGKQRIATLAKVLRERPGISFELEGHADPTRDGDGLRRFLVERKVKARKLGELLEAGTSVGSVDLIVVEPAERERFLRDAYDAETFVKPKNVLGFNKKLPAPEMEKLMLANTRASDDDLRALALRRATSVQSALAKAAPGTTGRLFLVAPRVGDAGGHVELKLKK